MTVGMTAIRGIAWDIDGTLVDSEPLHLRAMLAYCDGIGLDLRHLSPAHFSGKHMGAVWQELQPLFPQGLSEADFHAGILAHYKAGAAELDEIPGARAVVAAFDQAGLVQVCASNSGRVVVDLNLAALGLASVMKATVTLDDVVQGKPEPEPYLRAAGLAGLEPREMLAVEDSLTGLQAAKAAGMRTALLWHAPGEPALQPDILLRDLRDLPDLVVL